MISLLYSLLGVTPDAGGVPGQGDSPANLNVGRPFCDYLGCEALGLPQAGSAIPAPDQSLEDGNVFPGGGNLLPVMLASELLSPQELNVASTAKAGAATIDVQQLVAPLANHNKPGLPVALPLVSVAGELSGSAHRSREASLLASVQRFDGITTPAVESAAGQKSAALTAAGVSPSTLGATSVTPVVQAPASVNSLFAKMPESPELSIPVGVKGAAPAAAHQGRSIATAASSVAPGLTVASTKAATPLPSHIGLAKQLANALLEQSPITGGSAAVPPAAGTVDTAAKSLPAAVLLGSAKRQNGFVPATPGSAMKLSSAALEGPVDTALSATDMASTARVKAVGFSAYRGEQTPGREYGGGRGPEQDNNLGALRAGAETSRASALLETAERLIGAEPSQAKPWSGSAQPAIGTAAPLSVESTGSTAPRPAINTVLATPVTGPNWGAEFVGRMNLIVNSGQQEATIQLNPPELGRVGITISTEGDQAKILFAVHSAAAREAIELAMPKLREMLEQSGLQLAHSEVSDQHSSSSQRQAQTSNDALGTAQSQPESASAEPLLAQSVINPESLVDYYI